MSLICKVANQDATLGWHESHSFKFSRCFHEPVYRGLLDRENRHKHVVRIFFGASPRVAT
jgi:hypothetical protein